MWMTQDAWERRRAGCIGITLLVNQLSSKWVHSNQMEIMKALIHTLTDTKSDFVTQASATANVTLEKIIRVCCHYASGGKPMVPPSTSLTVAAMTNGTISSTSSSSSSSSSSTLATVTNTAPTSHTDGAAATASVSASSSLSSSSATTTDTSASAITTPAGTSGADEEKAENYEQGDISMTDAEGNYTSGSSSSTATSSSTSAPVSLTTPVAASPGAVVTGSDGSTYDSTTGSTTDGSAYGNTNANVSSSTSSGMSSDGAVATPSSGINGSEGKNEAMTDENGNPITTPTANADGSTVATPVVTVTEGEASATAAAVAAAAAAAAGTTSSSTSSAAPSSSNVPIVEDHGPPLTEKQQITIRNLIFILAPELLSGISEIRDCAQRLLTLVSELIGRSASQILLPYRDRFVGPLRSHSLHATPLTTRIGYISAATYCLSLRPPLVSGTILFSPSYSLFPSIAHMGMLCSW
jgi:hypothetical protein